MNCSTSAVFWDAARQSLRQRYRWLAYWLVRHLRVWRGFQGLDPQGINSTGNSSRSLWQWGMQPGLGLGVVVLVLQAGAGLAAERITLSYGLLERSIAISSLATYAETGEVAPDLRVYLRYLTPEQRQQFRQGLVARVDLSAVAVAQFLYTDQGEILLRRLGEVVKTDANLSGFYAIRSALILAAADPGGLTALNVLKNFPLPNIQIDLSHTLKILGDLQQLIRQTQNATALIDAQANLEAEMEGPLDLSTLPDLQQPGPMGWQRQTISLTDSRRNRSFPVDLYLPQPVTRQTSLPSPAAPVIVISHGLGSDRTTYAYLARHLASYGFAVAVPEHPGSNSSQLQALISGTASQVTSPAEFIDRPLDIQYLLDELEQRSQTDPAIQGRLNLQQVGVVGQSMGGYTALALAGADINLPQLATDCLQDDNLNLSLLLQCRVLELPQVPVRLRDERIKAIIALNPIGSSLLGPEHIAQIQIPVMIVSGSADTVAPALLEQIRPFTWLQTASRYFLMMQGGTHFSTIDVPPNAGTGVVIPLPSEVVGPDPAVAKDYLRVMSVAFFQTYVANQASYRPYLGAAYARSLSHLLLPLALVRSLNLEQLAVDPSMPQRASSTSATNR